jgi:hypothetical protein
MDTDWRKKIAISRIAYRSVFKIALDEYIYINLVININSINN